jgi:hypothetical protein
MTKIPSHSGPEELSAAIDPVGWVNGQSYGELKKWLRNVIWKGDTHPMIIPPSAILASYLAQLLLRTAPHVKADLRTAIPELLCEWNATDTRRSLDDLLILCGNLTCNEAEMVIARIIVSKLGETEEEVPYRRRALSTLQNIGTERTLNIFLRYLGDRRYAALCYRGLYRINPAYAAAELPMLTKLYRRLDAVEELKDVLKVLFKHTLTPPEYITVLRPFAEKAPPESFVEVLELLTSIKVLSGPFFASLTPSQSVEIFGPLLKRARLKDCERISQLLNDAGVTIEPPPEETEIWPEEIEYVMPTKPSRRGRQQRVIPSQPSTPRTGDRYYHFAPTSGTTGWTEKLPIVSSAELGVEKCWRFIRSGKPQVMSYILEEFDYPTSNAPSLNWGQ